MAIFDPFRRAMGIPTPVEIGEARRERMAIEQSQRPADKFAVAVADAMKDMDKGQASRTMKELGDTSLSGNDEVRWLQIARAAQGLADESVTRPVQNLDGALSKAVGDRALLETADQVNRMARYRLEPDDRIGDLLNGKRDLVANQTRGFMSAGAAAENNAKRIGEHMFLNGDREDAHTLRRDVEGVVGQPTASTRREWLVEANRARIAMAQTGLLSADRTVAAAMHASERTHLSQGSIAQTPNREQMQRLQGPEIVRAVTDRMTRNARDAELANAPMMTPAEQLAARGIKVEFPSGMSATDRARIGRSLNDPGRGQ